MQRSIEEELVSWINGDAFTCLGARAAVRQDLLVTHVYEELDSDDCTEKLHQNLIEFIDANVSAEHDFASFVAIFRTPRECGEEEFEQALWGQLGRLHRLDAKSYSWSEGYSSDTESSEFGFSVAGRPFFVAGLNPGSSRISRRFTYPALVFNSHEQFGRLKADGTYFGLQRRIRAKELRLQGSVNPMLADHGTSSEARQYSGRAVPADWKCPFHPEPGMHTPTG
ncbi:guanitoxin biosynthesis heme-dependent pre-guanitoxin N-hydroxylase GntA [Streptomyces poriferorum]|uniref:Guanitoxin biosynthesis heme-dependent pre-guanitoxin N-hydroxylase GntA n=1 Tax=Streptomyces poriferorum TaxID=2798799 RepID=A0ABY9J055_9ACTN|nr:MULTISPECIES: guanitoxin biosynthesis heme-dependent pre-guanitoxin N-hydroxylase GntA [Streptomyces]WSQ46764.1 YqcI/YcgG family protein [Streptomyces sp. NBC_01220]MBW5249426.1 YqcI/YcgG family protein [Streptomyces poriferorum]MBW5257672.1 YqcI/YcgG family protein [Streptomyces poriferorum]MDP5311599.1 guanitoxin biosynthesis heme-dependent pre-guanitoxin N-hydroxylase GntA [Streptomyces sp. Alt4]WLQ48002.1 guanitoxin biosynthesis heme-dependent pre-guanitoxin N-hydroxylase GntA [Streptom